MQENENIIEIKNLNVIYNKGSSNQVRALEGVSLEIEQKEWVIIFGPSGCGKSTLLNSIAGLETPTSGKVKVFGRDINKLDSYEKAEYRRKLVGMVFQSFHLIPSLKVIDNVCLPQVFWGQSLGKREEIAKIYLKRFGIETQAEKYPSDISGGQKQKVSIARALMNRPEIILADEPVGNLDSKSTYNVMTIFKELNEIDGKTIIMVTHDRQHLEYADKIVHVKDGKIVKIEKIKKRKIKEDGNSNNNLTTIERETLIPMDLRLLMNYFKDLSGMGGMGQLLEPFKVKQTFAHLMLPITNHQAEVTKNLMKGFFLGNLNKKQFAELLDKPIEKGGAGWDKRTALKFAGDVAMFFEESNKIDYSESLKSAMRLSDFFVKKYSIKNTEFELNVLRSIIEKRLRNEISREVVLEMLNTPTADNGVGLDRRTADKISRDLELLILIRYSG